MLGTKAGPTVRGVSINELVKACVNRRYMVPPLQRPPVWGPRDQQRLLASVLAGRPIGSMLVVGHIIDQHGGDPAVAVGDRVGLDGVRVTNTVQAQSGGPARLADEAQEPEAFILDGQQRLFALMSGFWSPRRGPQPMSLDRSPIWFIDLRRVVERLAAVQVEYRDMYIAMDTSIRRISRVQQNNPKTLRKIRKKCVGEAQSSSKRRRFSIQLGMLLLEPSHDCSAEPILAAFDQWYSESPMATRDPELANRVSGLLRRVRDYRVPVARIEECTDVEAASIFEQVNTRGRDLETSHIACANIFVRDPSARRVLRRIEIEAMGPLQGIKSQQALEASTYAGLPSDSDLLKRRDGLNKQTRISMARDEVLVGQISSGAEAVLAAMPIAAELLGSCGVVDFKSCPVPAVCVALLAAIARHPNQEEVARVGTHRVAIRRWWWKRTFDEARRTSGSMTVNRLLDDWDPLPRDTMDTWDTSPWTLDALDIDPRKVHSGAKAKALQALLRVLELKDFRSFDAGGVQARDLDLHHIFPRAWLAQRGKLKEGHCFANLTLIGGDTNRRVIRDKSPSEYVSQISAELGVTGGRAHLARVLAQHGIDVDLLEREQFEDFLEHRSQWFGERLQELERNLPVNLAV